jgi:hypothetical protein
VLEFWHRHPMSVIMGYRLPTKSFWFSTILLAAALCGPGAEAHLERSAAPAEVLDPLPPGSRMVTADGAGLFQPQAAETAATPGGFVVRSTIRQIDAGYRDRLLLAPATGKAAAALPGAPDPIPATVTIFKLPLFGDTEISLFKTGMSHDDLGSTILTGRVLNPEGGEATLVFHNGHLSGTVRLGARMFSIEPMADGTARIVETSPDKRPHADPLKPPILPAHRVAISAAPGTAAAPATIDILVAYTSAAAATNPDIIGAISLAISYTNGVMTNSGINAQMRLVGTMEVQNYSEAGKAGADILQDLQTGVGGFAAVHTERDTLGADLVSVWSTFTDACGISYVLENADTQDDSDFGYNVISTSFGNECLTDAVAHEIGHNLGAKHDRFEDDPTDMLTSQFNFGYVDIPDRIRTIMSYPNACEQASPPIANGCAIIPYHSSPGLAYQGHVLGIADALPNSADNVTKLGQIIPIVAQFRAGAPVTTPTTLVAAILPSSRSVQIGTNFSFFMTIINAGTIPATGCTIGLLGSITNPNDFPTASVTFQTTDPATNHLIGPPNQPVTIAGGASQSFVVFATVSDIVSDTFQPVSTCDNAATPTVIAGVNTITLTTSNIEPPDVIALAATAGANGIVDIPTKGTGAFAVATADLGAAGSILVAVDTGGVTLPVTAAICQTDPATAQCEAAPASTLMHVYSNGETPTFSIFATSTGSIAFNPATGRIFVRFTDTSGGTIRGMTSVAVRSP